MIDVIEGNRKYIKCLYVYNKIDMLSIDEIDQLARRPMSVVVSSQKKWNLELLLERIWTELAMVRIYTKKPSEFPDMTDAIILTPQRGGNSVRNAVRQIHVGLLTDFKCCLVWGSSAKHSPQHVGLSKPHYR